MTAVKKRNPGRPADEALQERRREGILRHAADAFAAHGYRSTDLQWVADELDISKATIYRYFPTKQELFLAAVRRGLRDLYDRQEKVRTSAGDPMDLLARAVATYLQFFKEHPQLVELFIQERAEFRDKRMPVYFQMRDARRGPWRKVIGRLIAQGRVRRMPVERILDVLGDVVYGTMFTNHFAGRNKSYRTQAHDILEVVFNGILTESERQRRAAQAV